MLSFGESQRLALRSAAFRLKHDVGKAVRWSAPEELEQDDEALRRRLAADLEEASSAFDRWRQQEGALFAGTESWAARIERLRDAVTRARRAVPNLASLQHQELEDLDRATTSIQEQCGQLYREVVAAVGPE
jgi:uncharacterized protein YicC (UPF0701 family)